MMGRVSISLVSLGMAHTERWKAAWVLHRDALEGEDWSICISMASGCIF